MEKKEKKNILRPRGKKAKCGTKRDRKKKQRAVRRLQEANIKGGKKNDAGAPSGSQKM